MSPHSLQGIISTGLRIPYSYQPLVLRELTLTKVTGLIYMAYSTQTLKAIGAKARISYELFHLSTVAGTWIIALGIKRQPCPYRVSRAGRAVFGRIHIRITNRPQNKDEIPCIKPRNNLLNVTMSRAKHVNLSLAHINAHSVKNKIASLQHYLCDSQIDVCAITNTWIKQDDPLQASDIPPPGYSIIPVPRPDGQQGG